MPCSTTWLTSTSMGTPPGAGVIERRRPATGCPATGFVRPISTASVEEGHVPHGPRLPLGVHHHQVPAVQGDGGVVGVSHPPADIHPRVSPHHPPPPPAR